MPAHGRSGDEPRCYRATAGVENALLRAGLLNLAAAALILLLHPVPEQALTLGFAAWVAVASLSAIVGAFGMRRQTASTRFTFVTTALPDSACRARRTRDGVVPVRRPG